MNSCCTGDSDGNFAGSAYACNPTFARARSRYHTPASMHSFPVGAALQDDGNLLPSGVFVGGSLPFQLAELALATKTSTSAEAITSGRTARGTRSNVQLASEGPVGEVHPRVRARPRLRELRDGLAHIASDLGEGCETLLERRMIHHPLAPARLPVGLDDEERVHALNLAQIALRDL